LGYHPDRIGASSFQSAKRMQQPPAGGFLCFYYP
jgi:hypothetical protein